MKEFSLDALAATILSAVTADVISRAFFGSAPFFTGVPHDLSVTHDPTYLLIAVLGIAAGLIGVAFQKTLYKGEDAADALWRKRPEWLRPVAGGLFLGLLLLVLPQMYGVGYPVMDRVFGGHYVLWFVVVLHGRQDPRRQPHALDRRVRRRVRALPVYRRSRRDRLRDHRQSPVRRRGRAAGLYGVVAMGACSPLLRRRR